MCVPVPVDWVALYVVHLERRNLQVATIQTVLSATVYANKICDLQDPTDNFLIRKLLLSIGKRPRSRDPRLQVLAVLLEKLVCLIA